MTRGLALFQRAYRHFGVILRLIEYEPSWFAESGSAVGIVLWSLIAISTHDFGAHGREWMFPAFGLVLGVGRLVVLFFLLPVLRVLCASAGALWWGWLFSTFWNRSGAEAVAAGYAIGFYLDVLSTARFSIMARRAPSARQ